MSKNILIVEGDAALSRKLRSELEAKGCEVNETSDGKGSIELIRRSRPDLVVMAVELASNQNGYLLCGKLKKDDDLKTIPVVIIGNPEGFAKHRELKARADEYVARPVDTQAFLAAVGGLIGFPAVDEVLVEEDNLSPLSLEEDDFSSQLSEEIAVETEAPASSGEELDLDSAFDDISTAAEERVEAPVELGDIDVTGEHQALSNYDADSALDGLGADDDSSEDKTTIGFVPDLDSPPRTPTPVPIQMTPPPLSVAATRHPTPPPISHSRPSPHASADAGELSSLRARIAELEASLGAAEERVTDAESRTEELERDLASRSTELEAARQTGGKSDKDFYALKDANNKKDKEILRLKTEQNEKDSQLLELRERETQLEQQVSESSGEMAKRDAQLKTLQARADQLGSERKRIDQQLLAAKEEARSATAKLGALQADLDGAQEQLRARELELDQLRNRVQELEGAHQELTQLRQDLEKKSASLRAAREEAESQRMQAEQTQIDLDSARTQVTHQATAFADEAGQLRQRITELEEEGSRNEERLTKLYARIKGEEQLRERTKKAIAIAQQLLEEQAGDVEIDVDEAA